MKRKRGIRAAAILVGSLLLGLYPISAKAQIGELMGDTQKCDWEFEYTGNEQIFTAPYAGEYEFMMYGAQGENCEGGKEGGYGDSMQVKVRLNKGDKVSVYVGGQSGYNGGGSGTVSHGGGATDIRINGERIAVAGGGGGGTKAEKGGDGGVEDSGNNAVLYNGSSDMSTSGTAGGGGGYYGGTCGSQTTHTHSGGCYTKCTGTLIWGNADNDGLSTGYCNSCGRNVSDSNQTPGAHPDDHNGNLCGIQILVCKKTSETTASCGGSSWYNAEICTVTNSFKYQWTGDGFCGINSKEKYALFYNSTPCLELYYDNVRVKKLYYNETLIFDHSAETPKNQVW